MIGVVSAAQAVLIENWRGRYTVPTAGLYPHQWSWDSAFVSLGLRHLSPRRAQIELDSLLSAQWSDGRIPQIVYDRRRDDEYSPDSSFWNSRVLPRASVVPTAGLVQPPLHAFVAWLVHVAAPDESYRRNFLQRSYDRLVAWHDYIERERTGASGLARIVHPWESGMDNSPYWDEPLQALETGLAEDVPRPDLTHVAAHERPSDEEYARYLYLAARYRDGRCLDDDETNPFQMEDPAVNALWARSELALACIAETIGGDPSPHRAKAQQIVTALDALWNEELGIYVARDARTGQQQGQRTVSGLIPLLLPGARTARLLQTLEGPHFGLGRSVLVPSHDLTARTFDPARYWRGPSWFNTAWLIAVALDERDRHEEARRLAAEMADLAFVHDFPEYVDPHTGDPRGAKRFSWTAALTVDLGHRFAADRMLRRDGGCV